MPNRSGLSIALFALTVAAWLGHAPRVAAEELFNATPYAPAASLTFATSRSTVAVGTAVTLSWVSRHTLDCVASGDWTGRQPKTGLRTVVPTKPLSTYTLTCRTGAGDLTRTAVVEVQNDPPQSIAAPELTLTASRQRVHAGAKVALSWTSTSVSDCVASGAWAGPWFENGHYRSQALERTSQFTLSCDSPAGRLERTVTVEVLDPATEPGTLMLSAGRYLVAPGESVWLSWSSRWARECVASGAWSGAQPKTGAFRTPPLEATSRFTLACRTAGTVVERTVVVEVGKDSEAVQAVPSLVLTAGRNRLRSGGRVTLSWISQGARDCVASGAWSGDAPPNGHYRAPPIETSARFTLSCETEDGRIERSVDVAVVEPSPLRTVEPKLRLTASTTAVRSGESVTLSWTGAGISNCRASGGWSGARPESGSETQPGLAASRSYTLTCDSPAGQLVAITSVQVSAGGTLLTWEPPRLNTDGTPLTDLTGYRIYIGTISRNYHETIELSDGSLDRYFLELAPGEYYLAMTAVDADGNESAPSNEVLKLIP